MSHRKRRKSNTDIVSEKRITIERVDEKRNERRRRQKKKRFFLLSIQWQEHDGKTLWWSQGYHIKAEVLRQRSFLAAHTDVSLALFDFYWCVRFPFTPGNAIRLPFLLLCSYLRLQTFLLNFTAHKGQACNITQISSSDVGPAGVSFEFIHYEGVDFIRVIQK